MNAKEIRDLSEEEVVEHIRTARRDLFGLRFQHATGALDNTAALTRVKRDIARLLTMAGEGARTGSAS
jgi:large subunit ribosomal protein L29